MKKLQARPYTTPQVETVYIYMEHAIAAGSVTLTVGGAAGSSTPMVESWEEIEVHEQGFNL